MTPFGKRELFDGASYSVPLRYQKKATRSTARRIVPGVDKSRPRSTRTRHEEPATLIYMD